MPQCLDHGHDLLNGPCGRCTEARVKELLAQVSRFIRERDSARMLLRETTKQLERTQNHLDEFQGYLGAAGVDAMRAKAKLAALVEAAKGVPQKLICLSATLPSATKCANALTAERLRKAVEGAENEDA